MKIKKVKPKTQLEYMKGVRKPGVKPTIAFKDRRKRLKDKAQKKDEMFYGFNY